MKAAESSLIKALEVREERGRHIKEFRVVQGACCPQWWSTLGVQEGSLQKRPERGQVVEGLPVSSLAGSCLFLSIIISSIPLTH